MNFEGPAMGDLGCSLPERTPGIVDTVPGGHQSIVRIFLCPLLRVRLDPRHGIPQVLKVNVGDRNSRLILSVEQNARILVCQLLLALPLFCFVDLPFDR